MIIFHVSLHAEDVKSGENLFKSHQCISCHSLEKNPSKQELSKIGPTLFGVTKRRELVWLKKFLAHPEKMYDDKIVAELVKKSHGILMPPTGLSQEQVESLINFLKTKI